MRTLSRDSQDRVADASALAGETINAVQTVQAFTLEALQTRRFSEAVAHSFDVAVAFDFRITITRSFSSSSSHLYTDAPEKGHPLARRFIEAISPPSALVSPPGSSVMNNQLQ